MPNIGFKTITLKEAVYKRLQKRANAEGTTLARLVTQLAVQDATSCEDSGPEFYLRPYSHKFQK